MHLDFMNKIIPNHHEYIENYQKIVKNTALMFKKSLGGRSRGVIGT